MLSLHQKPVIGFFDRKTEHPVIHPAAVDKEAQIVAVERAILGDLTSPVTSIRYFSAVSASQPALHFQHISGLLRVHRPPGCCPEVCRFRVCGGGFTFNSQSKPDLRIGQGILTDNIRDSAGLGGFRFQKFKSGRNLAKQVLHGNGGTRRTGLRFVVDYFAVIQAEIGAGWIRRERRLPFGPEQPRQCWARLLRENPRLESCCKS